MSAVNMRRSPSGILASASVSDSLSSRPSALLSMRYAIGRPSGPVVGRLSIEISSVIKSRTGTSSGTSAIRAPPLGKTIVTLRSAILRKLPLSIQMRNLTYAGDRPAIRVMPCMADIAFFDSAWVMLGNNLQTVGAAMFLDHSKLDFRLATGGPLFPGAQCGLFDLGRCVSE